MNILYIAPKYEGGIGGHAKRVAEKLHENNLSVKLMQVPHLPIKNLKNPTFTIIGSVKAKLEHNEYDVVHAWNVPSAFIMKKIKSRKKILSIHGNYGAQIEKIHSKFAEILGKKAELEALKIPDILTTDSKFVKKYYKEKFDVDFLYLPAPLDIHKFKNIEKNKEKKNQIMYIGRDSFEKGIDILKSAENKINCSVKYFTNSTWEDTMMELSQSKILIVPSRMESLPQVIKEAFFLKIPVIATNVGGIPEIVKNNENGILIEPENPLKLANTVNDLLLDNIMQKKLSENAFNFVTKNFSWDALLPLYLSLYRDN